MCDSPQILAGLEGKVPRARELPSIPDPPVLPEFLPSVPPWGTSFPVRHLFAHTPPGFQRSVSPSCANIIALLTSTQRNSGHGDTNGKPIIHEPNPASTFFWSVLPQAVTYLTFIILFWSQAALDLSLFSFLCSASHVDACIALKRSARFFLHR